MIEFANIARSQSHKFFWPGADREDVEQEAMLALVRHQPQSPGLAKTIVRRHLIDEMRRETQRRPQYVELVEAEALDNLVDLVAARETLWRFTQVPLTHLEQRALSASLNGEQVHRGGRNRSLDNAMQSVRRKFRAAV